jgi:regulator of sirC expression with transglutaminase-like and TPR domain
MNKQTIRPQPPNRAPTTTGDADREFVPCKLRFQLEDPRNSYLNRVLERRLGIPISLCIVYWTVAELLGLSLTGVNLPCHFMLRFDEDGQPWFIDPFDSGAIYDRGRCQRIFVQIAQVPLPVFEASIAPCSTDVVVTRMLRNLKAIYLRTGNLPSLLPVQRRLTALNPREPGELRDLGMLCAQTDHLAEAINPLRAYLGASPAPDDEHEVRAMLEAILRQIAQWN